MLDSALHLALAAAAAAAAAVTSLAAADPAAVAAAAATCLAAVDPAADAAAADHMAVLWSLLDLGHWAGRLRLSEGQRPGLFGD